MSREHGTRARYVMGEGPGKAPGCRCEACSWREAAQQARRMAGAAGPSVGAGCSMGEPCHQDGCDACYPQADEPGPGDLDRLAGEAWQAGDLRKAARLIEAARTEFPDQDALWDSRQARVQAEMDRREGQAVLFEAAAGQ